MSDDTSDRAALRMAGAIVEAEAARVRLEEIRAEAKAFSDRVWLSIYGPRDTPT